MGLTDIHTHILYGVDDGAKNLQDSMRLLTEEWEQGVDKVVLTPHYGPKFGYPKVEVLRERFYEICEESKKFYPQMKLYLGSELYYQENHTIKALEDGKALTFNDTKYVLVEFGTENSFSSIFRAVQEFGYAGYMPVIAHVERYGAVFQHMDRAEELVKAGAYLQVNVESLSGGIFNARASFCKKLIKEGLLHFIASDGHDLNRRRIDMKTGGEILQKKKEDKILYKNPVGLLEGKYI